MSIISNIQDTFDEIAFSSAKQEAIIGHLLENETFFSQSKDRIKPEWFHDVYCRQIIVNKLQFVDKNNRSPSIEELKNLKQILQEEESVRNKFYAKIDECLLNSKKFGLDVLSLELTNWLHSQIYKVSVNKSIILYNNKKPKEAFNEVEKAIKEINESSFHDDKEEKFTAYVEDFKASEAEYDFALTFGQETFEKLLCPKAKRGCFLIGDMSLIIAPTSTGKTSSMITILVANLLQKRDCLYIVHEARPGEIKERIWCNIMNCTAQELYLMYKNPEGQKKLNACLSYLDRYLTFMPMYRGGLTVEEVGAAIRKKQDDRLRKYGKGYDLVIDDYPAKLDMEKNKGNMNRRHIDEYVYNYFTQLGLELKFHSLNAIQTNREGSKINNQEYETGRLLTKEDVLESFGPVTAATNCWTINCNPIDKAKNRLIYYIDKSRNSTTGYAVVCKSNMAKATAHSNILGATYYLGTGTYADKLDGLLDKYSGQMIDVADLLK